jgi:hypothetical protein
VYRAQGSGQAGRTLHLRSLAAVLCSTQGVVDGTITTDEDPVIAFEKIRGWWDAIS